MTIRNRITELRHVRAGDLAPDERNWRRHPQAQQDALRAMLDSVGYADALIARETPQGLVLIDGHLRAGLDPEQVVPVLVTDLSEAEAGQVLATLDPLAAMAQADTGALESLVKGLAAQADDAFAALMEGMHGVDLAQMTGAPNEEGWPERERDDHPLGQMNFIVSEAQRERIEASLRAAASNAPKDPDNDNSNGNALAWIVDEWQALKT